MTVLQSLRPLLRPNGGARRGRARPGSPARRSASRIVLSPEGEPIAGCSISEQPGQEADAADAERAGRGQANGRHPARTASGTRPSYALGRTAGPRASAPPRSTRRSKPRTSALIGESNDPGLLALRRFLERWEPHRFYAALQAGHAGRQRRVPARGRPRLHSRSAGGQGAAAPGSGGRGRRPPISALSPVSQPRRGLHPAIKGVPGAQVAGASLVSFNLDAFKSYGKEQGADAPTSEAAAERYGAALNAMLASGERNRLRRGIGDAAAVFWADASGAEADAAAAEDWFARLFAPPADDGDAGETAKIGDALKPLAEGRSGFAIPALRPGVRFHVLGLSPNAARLSVRVWLADSFEALAENMRRLRPKTSS